MRSFGLFRPVHFLLLLAVLGLTVGLVVQPSRAATTYTVITVRVAGLYSNVGTTVYVNSAARGTIYGDGTVTLTFANLTSSVTISVDSYTPSGYPYYGQPYYMYPGTSWGQYGNNGVSFFCRGNFQTATPGVNTTLTFRYDPLFFLYVKSDRGTPEGTGWYLAGTLARVSVDSMIEEGVGTRYRFDKWTGGYMRDNANTPVNFVYMDSPKLVEAVWVTQHKLTVNSPYGQAAGSGWYDKDQTVTFSVTPSVDEGEGTRRIFSSWTGDYTGTSVIGTVAMSGPKTVTATWRTQYLLTVDPKGGQVDKATQWMDSGSSITVSSTSPCSVVEKKSRLVFAGWKGATTSTSNAVTLVMDGPKSLIATWKSQYYLIVETKYGTPNGEGWYDADSIAEFSVTTEVPMESPWGTLGGRYVFSGWTGDLTASTPRASVVMDRARTVTASWTSDYNMITAFFAVIAVAGAAVVVVAVKVGMFRGHWKQSAVQTGGAPSKENGPSGPKAAASPAERKKKESDKA